LAILTVTFLIVQMSTAELKNALKLHNVFTDEREFWEEGHFGVFNGTLVQIGTKVYTNKDRRVAEVVVFNGVLYHRTHDGNNQKFFHRVAKKDFVPLTEATFDQYFPQDVHVPDPTDMEIQPEAADQEAMEAAEAVEEAFSEPPKKKTRMDKMLETSSGFKSAAKN